MPTGKLGSARTHTCTHMRLVMKPIKIKVGKKKVNIGETILHPVGLELAKRVGIYIPR